MMTSKYEANYSSNSSANHKSGFETVVIVNCILNAPVMLLSIIGNALVLVTILRTPSLRSPSVIFLCNLAVSDLLVGLVVQPVYVAAEIARTVRALLQAANTMGFAGFGVSLTTMTAITVDRFLALHYHLQYPNLMTTSRAIYTIVTIWCIITLFSFSILWSPSIFYFLAAFGITICLLVCLVCFIKIHRIVRRHQLQIHVQQQAVDNLTDTNNNHIRQSTRSANRNFHVFPSHDFMLHSIVFCSYYFSYQYFKLDNSLDLSDYCSIHELVYQSISILLAYSRAPNGSF